MLGKVVRIEDGSYFTDNIRRTTIRIEQADAMFNEVRVNVEELGACWKLGDSIAVTMTLISG